jgi:TonB-linked SusC/RagA family outer membrane protein
MRKIALLLLLVLVNLVSALAQNQKITGRVLNANGQPVEGATVQVKGTTTGVSTNAKGEFTINAAQGSTLVISSVGFNRLEVKVTSGEVNVNLTETNQALADVVVIGYGAQRRSNMTSAVSVVKGEDMVRRPVSQATMALQGFAPGLVVQQRSGQPGADGGAINIRGISSINLSSGPLVVVDGVEGVSLNDVDPNIIESVSVLKDAAATAVYGVRGTNGVIVVKTKRGQNGKTSISYNGFLSKQEPTNFPTLLSSVDHLLLQNESFTNAGLPAPNSQALIDQYRSGNIDNFTTFNTDWKSLLFTNSGLMQNHNVIVSAGSDRVNFLASGTYLNQQGLIANNSFRKYDLRINGDVKVNKIVSFNTDLFYTNSRNIQPASLSPSEIIQRGISMARLFPGKFAEGQYGDAGQTNRINPIAAAEASGFNQATSPTLSMRFGIRVEPFKNFILEGSYNNRTSNSEAYDAKTAYAVYSPNPATSTYNFAQMIGDSLLSYSLNRFRSNQYYAAGTYSYNLNNRHEFKLQGGFQSLDNTTTTLTASRAGLVDPARPYLNLATIATSDRVSGSATDFALAGFFARLNYAFDQKYLLEISGRRDGTSRFFRNKDKQWGNFYAFSAGWIFTKERFMEKVGFLNYGKLRASYGKIGNQESGSNYPFVATLNAGTAYYFNNIIAQGSSLNNIPNEFLSWENSYQTGVGIDLGLLRNKLNITFDYYQKKIVDMIYEYTLPSTAGFGTGAVTSLNGASMINKGFELSTTYRSNVGKLNFSVTANLSDVRSTVLATDARGGDIVHSGLVVSRIGYPVQSYFLYRTNGLYQVGDNFNSPRNTGRVTGPGDIKYVDVNGNDTIDAKDRVLMGNNFPRYDYSLNLTMDYKGFDLTVFLFGVGKRDNYVSGIAVQPFNAGNWIASGLTSALDRWTSSKTDARYPRLFNGGNGNYVGSDFWLRNGAFMRVKHITLGYTLPKKLMSKAGIQQLRFYVNVVNPFTISDYEPGFDPELQNTSGFFYPIMKTYTAGVNLRF